MKVKESRIVYAHDSQGYYVGETFDYGGPMPHNCVAAKPELKPGFIPRWNGNKWMQTENHMGRQGYINGQPFLIQEYGPLPDGWSNEFIDPRSPGEIRKKEILSRLNMIDRLSLRPLRAMQRGTAMDEDETRLVELDTEAESLRNELASLS